MKIKNIFYLALASSLLFASCVKEEATDSFENIKLDKTFVTIDAKGTPVGLRFSLSRRMRTTRPSSLSMTSGAHSPTFLMLMRPRLKMLG